MEPMYMVGLRGLEPLTSRLSVVRSSQLSYRPVLAGEEGIEPSHDGVKVRCLTAWLLPNNEFCHTV
jgi:hypothetical protein